MFGDAVHMGDAVVPERLTGRLRAAAGVIRGQGSVLVVTHIDADGITAGSIASETLRRLGKRFALRFVNSITDDTVDAVNVQPEDAVWICDLGSAYMSRFDRPNIIVTDHHVPDAEWVTSGQTRLFQFNASFLLNPHLYGADGQYQVCGAGMTYLLQREIDPGNRDLAHLAVVGAVGDFQDDRECRLTGWNRAILDDAAAEGDVSVSEGVRYYGRETRPIAKFLEFGEDPPIPGITGNAAECTDLLQVLDIPLYAGGRPRTWQDLSGEERLRLTDALAGALGGETKGLIGEVYTVNRYPVGSGMHDAKEFATILNSCGRYDDAETGVRICAGDLRALDDAEEHRREHRRCISSALKMVRGNRLMRTRGNLQFFDAGDSIRDTVVGTVTGMVLKSDLADPGMTVMGFAVSADGVKVSARAPRELVDRGLNLSDVMREAAASVGGVGGGHSVAAGATVPADRVQDFIEAADAIIGRRLREIGPS